MNVIRTMTLPLESSINIITGSIASLTDLTRELSDTQAAQIKKLERFNRWLAIALVGIVALAGFNLYQVYAVHRQGEAIVAIQSRTSGYVLCPLYELFLNSYNVKGPNAVSDPALYEQSFDVIEEGAKVLQCKKRHRGVGTG